MGYTLMHSRIEFFTILLLYYNILDVFRTEFIDQSAKYYLKSSIHTFAGIIPGSTNEVKSMSNVEIIYNAMLTAKGPELFKESERY